MLIRNPTGYYKDAIPTDADSGNITYLISMTGPPRSDLYFLKVPNVNNMSELEVINSDRRPSYGELLFTVSSSNRSNYDNNLVYYYGQIIDFGQSAAEADRMPITKIAATQHAISAFDYNLIGLTNDDANIINASSASAYDTLIKDLNIIKERRLDAEHNIKYYQKLLNEAQTALNATSTIYAVSPSNDLQQVITKLEDNVVEFNEQVNNYIDLANQYASQAQDKNNELLKLMEAVK